MAVPSLIFLLDIDRAGLPTSNYTPSRLFAIEELPIALGYLVLWHDNPRQAIIDAVNSGRDTDSIGVMTAAIAGALYGDSIFDSEEIRIIDEKSRLSLDDMCMRFAKAVKKIILQDVSEANAFALCMEGMKA